MARYRDLKGNMDKCPYDNGKVDWGGFDEDYEHPLSPDVDKGVYQCTVCHMMWHENGKAYKQDE